MPVVIDVNVGIVANGKSKHVDIPCQLACIDALSAAQNDLVCIDAGDAILKEFRQNLSMSGQPGVGDEFMLWLHQNQCVPERCERVSIHVHADRGYEEFPDDPQLSKFDRSDRKYVAVALTSHHKPTIINATDPDWKEHQTALKTHGVRIRNLCPQCLQ